ncbi:MAG: hypothetical protein PHG03_00105 [Bacilli bacterium]|nr:hypothetical protein [Bacilli bacterium]MDD4794953.1 hypothetical protein [Bacilli bacterium]
MKNNKYLTNFKFENVIFGLLAITYIYAASMRAGGLNNFITVIIQLVLSFALKLLLEYIRKNPKEFANSILELFQD